MILKTGKGLLAMSLFAGCVLSAACAPTPEALTARSVSVEREVQTFEAEVMNAYNRGDAAKAASHYATDAFVFIPGQQSARGREAIAANIARFMHDPNFRLGYVPELARVSASADLASTRGKLTITYTDPKTKSARTINSNYLLVMRRQPGSEWQVVEDISF